MDAITKYGLKYLGEAIVEHESWTVYDNGAYTYAVLSRDIQKVYGHECHESWLADSTRAENDTLCAAIAYATGLTGIHQAGTQKWVPAMKEVT